MYLIIFDDSVSGSLDFNAQTEHAWRDHRTKQLERNAEFCARAFGRWWRSRSCGYGLVSRQNKMLRSYPWFGNTKVICWSMWDMVDDSDGLFWILRMCALLPVGRCNWPMQGFFLRTAHEWQREWMAPKCAGRNVAVRLHLPVPLVRWVSLFRPMRIYPRHRRNNLTVNHRIQLLSADDS